MVKQASTLKVLLGNQYDEGFKEGKLQGSITILRNILDEMNKYNVNEAKLNKDSILLAIKELQ